MSEECKQVLSGALISIILLHAQFDSVEAVYLLKGMLEETVCKLFDLWSIGTFAIKRNSFTSSKMY